MGKEELRGEHEHEPVARRRGPLQEREVASGVLEQRAFVDHRQLEVGVGVVDRLPSRLGDDDQRERDRAERERGTRPDAGPGGAADHASRDRSCPRRARRRRATSTSVASTKTEIVELAARAHQREPVRDVPGRRGDGEARQREEPGERERVVSDAESGALRRQGRAGQRPRALAATTAGAKR